MRECDCGAIVPFTVTVCVECRTANYETITATVVLDAFDIDAFTVFLDEGE